MADQTVSLKLEGDASDLKNELRQSADAMDDLAGTSTAAGSQIEQSVSGASSAWEQHSGVINATAAAMGAAGALMEGFARSQQDATVGLARTSTATGIQSDALRTLAADTANVTFSTEDVIGTFHALGRQGIDTEDDLQRVANVWDMVADATGENVVALAEGSVALRTLGIDARNPEEALDALGFITTQTSGSVGEFLQFVERTGPQLRGMGMDVDTTAALLGVMEQELGLTGRAARSEFRSAVNEANGDLDVMLDILGVTPASLDAMTASVAGSSSALEANAQALADSFTPMQRLSAWADEVSLRYGGLADAAGMLSPVLIGAGGMVFAINQVVSAKATWGAQAGRLAGVLGRGAGVAGVAVIAALAVERLGRALIEALDGAPATVDDLALAFDGLAASGEIPDVVAGSLDNLEDALGRVLDPKFTDDWWGPLSSPQADVATESVENLDRALAEAARSGNQEALAEGLDLVAQMADNLGVPVDDLIARALPEYGRAAAAAGIASDDAAGDIDGLSGSFDDLEGEIEETRNTHAEWTADLRAAVDPVFAMDRALQNVESAQDDYNKAVKDHGPASSEARQASMRLAGAVADAEQAAINGDLSFGEFNNRLNSWVQQGHITADQAGVMRQRVLELRGEAENYAGNYHGTATFDGSAARRELERLNSIARSTGAQLAGVRSVGGITERASGGPVGPEHGLTLVGEEGPELVTFGESGYVHDATTTARMVGEVMPSAPSAATASGVTQPQPIDLSLDLGEGITQRYRIERDREGRTNVREIRAMGVS